MQCQGKECILTQNATYDDIFRCESQLQQFNDIINKCEHELDFTQHFDVKNQFSMISKHACCLNVRVVVVSFRCARALSVRQHLRSREFPQ
jgi:hypothetical protein